MPEPLSRTDAGKRFGFGKNWQRFLNVLDDERIAEAERSLREMLGPEALSGKSFLDIGSGSGLFSLAAARLGARRVHSFDFDPDSVACTEELKRRYRSGMESWTIERGSVLDEKYLGRLGQFDVVYSWGVLHHTGDMWRALEAVAPRVAPGGKLFIAIYNDQGLTSRVWTVVKRIYNAGWLGRWVVISTFVPLFIVRGLVGDLLRGRNPLRRYREYKYKRGMSILHDWLDWLGGYPFEVAAPEKILAFYGARGFILAKLKTAGSRPGNNEFVFVRQA
jgi:2-polyprenyl-3-methyl-5-hydroxy-6-metoxy-1,4-benzoquinol methylase